MPQSPLSDHEVPNNLIQLQVPITCDYFQKTSNEELILVNYENTQHSFFHNYPSNSYIHAVRVFSGKNYSQSYKIVSLGQYPTKVIYTRKEKGINYKVPNNYQVETILNGLTVLCKTQYQFSRKIVVKYTVEWTDENVEKEIATQTLTILKENNFTSPSEEIIASLETIIFKINGEIVELNFHSDNITDFIQYLDSIIRACDETLISRDSYHRLVKAVPNLIREHVIEKHQNEITKTMNILIPIKLFNIHSINFNDVDNENQQDIDGIEFNDNNVGNSAYQSIVSLLDIIIPILTTSMPPVLKIGDKINIKLSGNRRNVGRKQKHVMLTMCILNEEEAVLSPAHQYSVGVVIT
ncbi:hypothetical protein GLOIN_2v1777777 [Rhizophagus clarus]|uniref:Uncharacterized protein n=1 Tax=Rhizophagus clarus TaxID=94130 RepID=A0A8H3QI25_9GLOM|nr:hypothetical protein GLOIN_2v1777777 [Rhizophagus clarus]